MKNILLVTSSPRGEASSSTRVAHTLVDRFTAEFPDAKVKSVDLAQNPPPVLTGEALGALFAQDLDALSPELRHLRELSDGFIQDLQEADVIVIGSGMINFSVPAALKAWIDLIAKSGVTFRYTASGPEGLLTGKKTYLVLASGGIYSSGPSAAYDHQAPYLQGALGFMGLTDQTIVRVEGTAISPESAENALAGAIQEVGELALA